MGVRGEEEQAAIHDNRQYDTCTLTIATIWRNGDGTLRRRVGLYMDDNVV